MAILSGQELQDYLAYKQGALPAQNRGFIGNLAAGLTQPFGQWGRLQSEMPDLSRAIGSAGMRMPTEYTPQYMTSEEFGAWKKNPLLETVKPLAGMAAFAVPGAGAFGGGLKGAMLAGGAAGGLAGFGTAKPGEEIKGALTGGLLGAGTGGVGFGLSKGIQKLQAAQKPLLAEEQIAKEGLLSRLGKGMEEKAKIGKLSTIAKRKIGYAPTVKQGGLDLVQKMQDVGVDFSDFSKAKASTSLINKEANKALSSGLEDVANQGYLVDRTKLLSFLDDLKSGATTVDETKAIDKVIDTVKADLRFQGVKTTGIPPETFRKLKGAWGSNKAKYNMLRPTEETAVWRKLYDKSNQLLDETLQQGGFEDLRNLNDILTTTIKGESWLKNVAAKTKGKAPFGFTDVVAGAGGLAALGPVGAVGTMGAKRVLTSEPIERAFWTGLGKTGKVLQRKGLQVKTPQVFKNILGTRAIGTTGRIGTKLAPIIMARQGLQYNQESKTYGNTYEGVGGLPQEYIDRVMNEQNLNY